MLFYLSLRNAFDWMPASPLSSPDMRQRARAHRSDPGAARSAEDWLTLAEVSLSYDGRQAALDAADQARAFRLSPAQKARLDLVDALVAGPEKRYAEAAPLFQQAAPRLDRQRRAIALYGGYFARSLANPDRVEQPPVVAGGGPYAALAEAWTAASSRTFRRRSTSSSGPRRAIPTIRPCRPSAPSSRSSSTTASR